MVRFGARFLSLFLLSVGSLLFLEGEGTRQAKIPENHLSLEKELLLLIGEAQTSCTRVARLARAVARCCEAVPTGVSELG